MSQHQIGIEVAAIGDITHSVNNATTSYAQSLPISLSFIIFATAAILLVISLIKIKSLQKSLKEALRTQWEHEHILSSASSGYYYYDTKKHKEIFSIVLVRMLNFLAKVDTFEQLLTYFEPTERIKLHSLYQSLLDGKKNDVVRLKALVRGNKIFFECSGDRIVDSNGALSGIVIWFYDITNDTKIRRTLSAEAQQKDTAIEQYSLIINNASFPMWVRNKDLRIIFCNPCYKQIIGDEENENTKYFPELTSGIKAVAEWSQETTSVQYAEHHIVINGERRLMRVTEMPAQNEEYFVGYAKDITDLEDARKEVERHLSAQSDLLESSACANAVFGSDTKLKFYNNAFARLWSLDTKWLDNAPTYGELLEILREKRKLPEQTNFQKFKQEQLRWFTDLLEPHDDFIHLPDGRALRVIVIPHALGGLLFSYEDMTDKLEFERSYNTMMAVQKATLDNLNEGICVFGPNGRITLHNPTFAKMWHLKQSFLESEPHISEVLDATQSFYSFGENWDFFKDDMVAEVFRRSASLNRIERADGSVLDVVTVPLPDGATLITYVDVTDSTLVERSLRERNEALQEADRLKTEFLANVSYELRSPLTTIIGFSEMLKDQILGALNEKQAEYVSGIHNSSQYLISLINDILDLASIEAGYMTLEPSRFDIHESLHSILPLIQERTKEHHIDIEFKCNKNIGKLFGDERRIKQAIFKLLSNAIKFTEDEGQITLGAKRAQKGEIAIWVEDNGIGISPKDQKDLFEKFKKSSNSTSHNRSGAGLGLTVVKNFIELHGGHITLESTVGKGTKVTCYLPRDNQELRFLSPTEQSKEKGDK